MSLRAQRRDVAYYNHLSEVCSSFDQALDDADGLGVWRPGMKGQTMVGSLRDEFQKLVRRYQERVNGCCSRVQEGTRRRWEWLIDKAQLLL